MQEDKLKSYLRKEIRDNQRLDEGNTALRGRVAELATRLDAKEIHHAEAIEHVHVLREKLAAAEHRTSQCEAANNDLRAELDNREMELKELINAFREEAKATRRTIKQMDIQNLTASDMRDGVTQELTATRAQLHDAHREVNTLRQQLSTSVGPDMVPPATPADSQSSAAQWRHMAEAQEAHEAHRDTTQGLWGPSERSCNPSPSEIAESSRSRSGRSGGGVGNAGGAGAGSAGSGSGVGMVQVESERSGGGGGGGGGGSGSAIADSMHSASRRGSIRGGGGSGSGAAGGGGGSAGGGGGSGGSERGDMPPRSSPHSNATQQSHSLQLQLHQMQSQLATQQHLIEGLRTQSTIPSDHATMGTHDSRMLPPHPTPNSSLPPTPSTPALDGGIPLASLRNHTTHTAVTHTSTQRELRRQTTENTAQSISMSPSCVQEDGLQERYHSELAAQGNTIRHLETENVGLVRERDERVGRIAILETALQTEQDRCAALQIERDSTLCVLSETRQMLDIEKSAAFQADAELTLLRTALGERDVQLVAAHKAVAEMMGLKADHNILLDAVRTLPQSQQLLVEEVMRNHGAGVFPAVPAPVVSVHLEPTVFGVPGGPIPMPEPPLSELDGSVPSFAPGRMVGGGGGGVHRESVHVHRKDVSPTHADRASMRAKLLSKWG